MLILVAVLSRLLVRELMHSREGKRRVSSKTFCKYETAGVRLCRRRRSVGVAGEAIGVTGDAIGRAGGDDWEDGGDDWEGG